MKSDGYLYRPPSGAPDDAGDKIPHTHEPEHLPTNGTGYAVCACGATLRYEQGKPTGCWHACTICVPNWSATR